MSNSDCKCETNSNDSVDVFRDTPIRYLGYANEVGEAFRALVSKYVVRFSYVVACGYVVADAHHKGQLAYKYDWPDAERRSAHVCHAVLDTVAWQGLASVAIPGFTINRACRLADLALCQLRRLPAPARRACVTAAGLALIPVIVRPIDELVEAAMNRTARRWYQIVPAERSLVHHHRD